MKVKTATKIQIVLHYILVAIFLPIGIVGFVFDKIVQFFRFIISLRDKLLFFIGNKLLLASKESKEIKNDYFLKEYTAKQYNDYLKVMKENEKP